MLQNGSSDSIMKQLPQSIFLLGYGAIGKCFTEILLKNYPNANFKVFDKYDNIEDPRFEYIKFKVERENIKEILNYIKEGDILVDLSTNIDAASLWEVCAENRIMYLNTAFEDWDDCETQMSFPTNLEEMYDASSGYSHDLVLNSEFWNSEKGATTVFEHGMNPGLISHFVKKGLFDAAEYFLTRKDWTDLDMNEIRKRLEEKNYTKLAQAMGLHTIHCSEFDDQYVDSPPKNLKEKLYNTWSCRGFITEGLDPLQAAQGSHEDKESQEFPRLKDNSLIMSWTPSKNYWAKSWVPFQNIKGCLIPHGEAYTIRSFFHDKETGYAPSQYYVYDYNPYAKEFFNNLSESTNLDDLNPEFEVINPVSYKLHGYDKVGALLIFGKNRGWWSGTIMDEFDAAKLFNHKFGPTVLQVAGGVYSAFLWMLENRNSGNKWAEELDSEFVLESAKEYLGRVWSDFVDLSETHIKDCYKFESFLIRK